MTRYQIPGREAYGDGGMVQVGDPLPPRRPLRSYSSDLKWRRRFLAGVACAKWAKESFDTRRRSRLAETQRMAVVAEMKELAVWWDGPGSEGTCV